MRSDVAAMLGACLTARFVDRDTIFVMKDALDVQVVVELSVIIVYG